MPNLCALVSFRLSVRVFRIVLWWRLRFCVVFILWTVCVSDQTRLSESKVRGKVMWISTSVPYFAPASAILKECIFFFFLQNNFCLHLALIAPRLMPWPLLRLISSLSLLARLKVQNYLFNFHQRCQVTHYLPHGDGAKHYSRLHRFLTSPREYFLFHFTNFWKITVCSRSLNYLLLSRPESNWNNKTCRMPRSLRYIDCKIFHTITQRAALILA